MTIDLDPSQQQLIDFEAAFDEGLAAGVATLTPPADPAPEDTPPLDDPIPVEPTPEPAPEPVEPEPTSAPVEPEPAPAPTPTDWESQFKALQAQIEEMKKGAAAPEPVQPTPEPAPVEPPLYSTEESKVLEEYQRDWPDIAKAEALSRRAEYKQLLDYIFTQMDAKIQPIQEVAATVSSDSHYNAIVAAHPDYDSLVDKVEAWIGEKPEFLKKSLTDVASNGNTNDVIALVAMYKKEVGTNQPGTNPPTVTTTQETQPPITQPAKKAAAQRLSVVSSQRSTASGSEIPDDFEGAFKAFLEGDSK